VIKISKNLENAEREQTYKVRLEGENEWTEYITDSNQNFAPNIAEGNEKPIPTEVSNEVNISFALHQVVSSDSQEILNSGDIGRNHSAI